MTQFTATRSIDAPIDLVFETVADIENFSKAVPHIVKVEFLTPKHSGVGTRFVETRMMKGKEASTELEVVEYTPNERIRLISDTHGTVWDTVFTVTKSNGRVDLTMVMDAKAYKIMARIVTPLIKGMVQKALEADMDSVKAYCEER